MVQISELAEFQVVARRTVGDEHCAYGLPQPGVQLRWSVNPLLRYPLNGFRIERWVERGEIPVGRWTTLADVDIPRPVGANAAARRASLASQIEARVSDVQLVPAGETVHSLELGEIVYPRVPVDQWFVGAGNANQPGIRARRRNLLDLSLLHPHVAHALGFSYTDSTLPPGVPARYRVHARWGREAWPWFGQRASQLRPRDIGRGQIDFKNSQLYCDRQASFTEPPRRLALAGSGFLPLQVEIPRNVQEVVVLLASDSTEPFTVKAFSSRSSAALPDVTVDRSGSRISVRSPRVDIRSLEILQPSSGDTVWMLSYIGYRLSVEAVQDRYVEIEVDADPTPPASVAITHHAVAEPATGGSLEMLRAGAGAPVELAIAADPPQPLAQVSRESDGHRATLTGEHAAAPKVEPLVSALLDGSESRVRLRQGAHYATSGFSHGARELVTGSGYAQIPGRQLASLGQGLAISLWVFSDDDGGFRTLVDHDYRRSFWLGLVGRRARLRFWINGSVFESSGRLSPFEWSHITVVYDGHRVRFAINGRPAGSSAAALGPVNRGYGNRINLGGVPSGRRVEYPFGGRLRALVLSAVRYRNAALPDLKGRWPLAGGLDGIDADSGAVAHGDTRFVDDHPDVAGARALSLSGTGWLELPSLDQWSSFDCALTIRAWIRPDPGISWPTILGSDFARSVWLGLTPGRYRLRFRLNGEIFEGVTPVQPDAWSHIAVVYDGEAVRLYVNGRLDARHPARLGPVREARSVVALGSSAGSFPFHGRIAQVEVFASADEGGPLALATTPLLLAYDANEPGDMIEYGAVERVDDSPFEDGTQAIELTGAGWLRVVNGSPPLPSTEKLTIEAWIKVSEFASAQTIVGMDWQSVSWLGVSSERKLRVYFNGHRFESRARISAGSWTRVIASYDGSEVRIYVQSQAPDARYTARLGAVSLDRSAVTIGADAPRSASRSSYRFSGRISHVRVWGEALAPEAIDRLESEWRQAPAYDWRDSATPTGRHRFRATSVDLFGIHSPWSAPANVTVENNSKPPPPDRVSGSFVKPSGTLRTVRETSDGQHVLETDIRLPDGSGGTLAGDSALLVAAIARLSRHRVLLDGTRGDRDRSASFLIEEATAAADGSLSLTVVLPPLSGLTPSAGDRISIDIDLQLRIAWRFGGWSRLVATDVDTFTIYARQGSSNSAGVLLEDVSRDRDRFAVSASASALPPGFDVARFVGKPCLVGPGRFVLEDLRIDGGRLNAQLRYPARPVIEPSVGERLVLSWPSEQGEQDLAENFGGENFRAPVEMPAVQRLDALSMTVASPAEIAALPPFDNLPVDTPILKTSVSAGTGGVQDGAVLTGYAMSSDAAGWSAYTVVGTHEGSGQLDLFVRPQRSAHVGAAPFGLRRARLLPGVLAEQWLLAIPEFPAGDGTRPFEIGVTCTSPGNRESALSGLASVVAVDRAVPASPPAPRVAIAAADYHGNAEARVAWAAGTAPSGQFVEIHRAADSNVFAFDVMQRRQRAGAYDPGMLPSPDDVMADDADFSDWLAVAFPGIFADWRTVLFADPRSASSAEADRVWEAWSARFYPSLNDAELLALASRVGQEGAFTRVGQTSAEHGYFVDSLRGLARNRFLYRLRARSVALVEAQTFSPPSDPARSIPILGPPAPEFISASGGEREVTLEWSPLLDRHVVSYRLYRTETEAELADLRYFGPDSDPRVLAELPDPLIRCRDRRVTLPEGMDSAAVIAVHALSELDPNRAPHDQPRAFDYLARRDSPGTLELRRIADGVALALVFSDSSGETRALTRVGDEPPYVDSSGRPLRDYFYCLVAIDTHGVPSDPSTTMAARSYDYSPAAPVRWIAAEFEDSLSRVALRFAVEDAESRVIVQRRSDRSPGWKAIGDWQRGPVEDTGPPHRWIFETFDPDIDTGTYQYRVRVVNGSGQANVEYNPVVVTVEERP